MALGLPEAHLDFLGTEHTKTRAKKEGLGKSSQDGQWDTVLQHRGQDTNGSMKIRHKEAPITEDTGAWWVRGCGLSCGSRVCC